MKRLSTGILAAIVAIGFGLTSVSAATTTMATGNIGTSAHSSTQVAQASLPPADFGTPPSGEVPILFNDRHVYSKPDRLKANRVLAALVRGNTILIPLRSLFEQMGATVSYDPASKTVDVSKPGSDVKVTVGRPEVVINGESRPLDVPPEIYKGAVVVPVRVISEGMGAYVQWVPERKTVVIRYVQLAPASPPPPPPTQTPAPITTPVATPTPVPTAKPTKNPYEHFVVGDYVFQAKVYNEFNPGSHGTVANGGPKTNGSFAVRGAVEFPLFGLPWMLEGDYRNYNYPHNANFSGPAALNPPCPIAGDPGCVTVIGGNTQTYVQGFAARDTDFDGRFGLKIADPRIYIGVGYLHREENYGYVKQNGFGFGAEKLPDLDQPFSVYGSVWYYPSVQANFSDPTTGAGGKFAYRDLKYQIGGTYTLGAFAGAGLFLDFGFLGDTLKNKSLAPGDASHSGPYAGLGIKF